MERKELRKFDIDIFGLKLQAYDFHYDLKDSFFASIEESPVLKGNIQVDVELKKAITHIEAVMNFSGSVELECDRSLDLFEHPINMKRQIIFKFGDEPGELSDEITVIHHDAEKINLAHPMFEFICVEIPMKKLHPRFADEDDEEEEEMVYQTEIEEEEEEENEEIDPRWKDLLKLKNN
jgi:uncharacterized protein